MRRLAVPRQVVARDAAGEQQLVDQRVHAEAVARAARRQRHGWPVTDRSMFRAGCPTSLVQTYGLGRFAAV